MKAGKISENILKRSVLRQIKSKQKEVISGAGLGRDCALFSLGADTVVCVQEAMIACTEQDLVKAVGAEPYMSIAHLIQKTANNLSASGAAPIACMLAIVLPVDTEESVLKALMCQAEGKCKELSMDIAGGQTRVSEGVRIPFVTVTGIGKMAKNNDGLVKKPFCETKCEGILSPQDIVVTKWIGLQGTAILAKRHENMLKNRYPAHLIEEAQGFDKYLSVLPEAKIAMEFGVTQMRDVSEGGIFAALWELAERTEVGMTVDMKKLPLRQETVEVCEQCDANPYELLSGGSMVIFTVNGEELVELLCEQGIPACVVGQTNQTKDRILTNQEEIRYMDKPKQDAIYRNRS